MSIRDVLAEYSVLRDSYRVQQREILATLGIVLEQADIEYAYAGGVAVFMHNYHRNVEGIDIIINARSACKVRSLIRSNVFMCFPGTTHHRKNTTILYNGCKINVLVEGTNLDDDNKVPHPKDVRELRDSVWIVTLPSLVSLKLMASRAKDHADIVELMKRNQSVLTRDLPMPGHINHVYTTLYDRAQTELRSERLFSSHWCQISEYDT